MKKKPLLRVNVRRKELWLERALTADWMVAYRLHVHGETVAVSEVRVFPNEPDGGYEEDAEGYERHVPERRIGHWSVERRGSSARVPHGGVSTSLLRRVTLGHDVHSLDAIVKYLDRHHPTAFGRGGIFDAVQLTRFTRGRDTRRGSVGGRGRPALSDAVYVDVARRYTEACQSGSTCPTTDVARELGLRYDTVRGRLGTARARGLLTSTKRRGVTGGRLTPRGRLALRRGRKKR